ncbi:MAG: carboxypeptidase-like regulatory domain-containing protein [Lewinella sp.]
MKTTTVLPNEYPDQELLRRWISGAITAPEEAELERRARTDAGLKQALTGLQDHPAENHASIVQSMTERARPGATRRSLFTRYAAAATVLVLLGIAALLLPRYFDQTDRPIAQEQAPPPRQPAPAAAPESVSPAPPPPAPIAPTEAARTTAEEPALAKVPDAAGLSKVVEDDAVVLQDAEVAGEFESSGVTVQQARRQVTAPVLPPPQPLADHAVASRAAAAPESVSGRVTDEDGNPIADAEVRRVGLPFGTTTDSLGNFQLPADVTLNQIEVSHPGYEEEILEVFDTAALLQISMNELVQRARFQPWTETAAVSNVPLEADRTARAQARPEEGYRQLRTRIEEERPDNLPAGRVKVSFLVNEDGSLSDFRFRGQPGRATMDYVGNALVESSTWEVVKSASGGGARDPIAPVRVYFTLRFE